MLTLELCNTPAHTLTFLCFFRGSPEGNFVPTSEWPFMRRTRRRLSPESYGYIIWSDQEIEKRPFNGSKKKTTTPPASFLSALMLFAPSRYNKREFIPGMAPFPENGRH